MKITELMQELQAIKKQHGNVQVFIADTGPLENVNIIRSDAVDPGDERGEVMGIVLDI